MTERHRAPSHKTRSAHCSPPIKASQSQLPSGLVGPSAEVPVQIEGVYAKALLDSGSQVTILYRSFYNTYLKHLPLQSVENLEIWGLSSHQYPYDSEFTEAVTGVPQVVDALALVCPDPQTKEGIAILVGTNTHLVRKLFQACKKQAGDGFLNSLNIHPVMKEAFESIKPSEVSQEDACKHGTMWFTKPKPVVIKPGQTFQLTGLPKFPGKHNDSLVLVEQPISADGVPAPELEVRPEVHLVSREYPLKKHSAHLP